MRLIVAKVEWCRWSYIVELGSMEGRFWESQGRVGIGVAAGIVASGTIIGIKPFLHRGVLSIAR